MTSGIPSCPTEILWKIFLELRPDYASLLRCRATCRRFKDIVDSSIPLQLGVRLDAWGYTLPTSSPTQRSNNSIPLPDLLKKLEDHVEAWRTLDWEESRQPINDLYHLHDFAHGYFVYCNEQNGSSIVCVQLPSRVMGTETRTYTINVDFVIFDLAIDPTQNLLVTIEVYAESLFICYSLLFLRV